MPSSVNESKPLVAFFGATGGCCAAALTRSLNAGFTCTACTYLPETPKTLVSQLILFTVARTPAKLTELLLSKGVSQSTITSYLHITEGDVLDDKAVKSVLSHDGKNASIILSGIGNHPFFTYPSPLPLKPFSC